MEKVSALYIRLEEAGALAMFLGLVFLIFYPISVYTQVGIVFWLSAQFAWLYWRKEYVTPATAIMFMGVLNFIGSASFFYGSVIGANVLGCFISAAYLISASQQFLSGMVRTSCFQNNQRLAFTQAMKCLVIAACFQMIAAMGFIVLAAIPGLMFSIAAVTGLIGHVLRYQQSLLKPEETSGDDIKEARPALHVVRGGMGE